MAGNDKAYWKLEVHWVVWFEWGVGVLKNRQRAVSVYIDGVSGAVIMLSEPHLV